MDISLIDDLPKVLDVLKAIRGNYTVGKVFMAEEFRGANTAKTRRQFELALDGIPLSFEPHIEFKKRVPQAIRLIRTGDTVQYANMILESARTRLLPPRQSRPCTLVTL